MHQFTIGNLIAIITVLLVGYQSYLNKRSNDSTTRQNRYIAKWNTSKETIIAIREFSSKVLPVLRTSNLSESQAIRLITYINRWDIYLSEGLVNPPNC